MEEKFFTTEQVATMLQVHPFTILRFIKKGKLKGVKLGRMYRIKESDISAFIDQQSTKSKEIPAKQEIKHPTEKNKNDKNNSFYVI